MQRQRALKSAALLLHWLASRVPAPGQAPLLTSSPRRRRASTIVSLVTPSGIHRKFRVPKARTNNVKRRFDLLKNFSRVIRTRVHSLKQRPVTPPVAPRRRDPVPIVINVTSSSASHNPARIDSSRIVPPPESRITLSSSGGYPIIVEGNRPAGAVQGVMGSPSPKRVHWDPAIIDLT